MLKEEKRDEIKYAPKLDFSLQINVYIYIISLPNSLQDFQFKFQIQNSKGLSSYKLYYF